ncbi:MAG: bifunctional folylpolyglutamate synthase/dihydrofolate synthase [Bacteroidetes bacterium]|nr:MAG: bifunctional folylpolyglutamate synthase/dihydrofolate synthase [Bacteroidota bacterium]
MKYTQTENRKQKTGNSSISFLYSLQKFGIKLGLRNMEELLEYSGNPQSKFPSIHIAGTNGKGSTAAMIAAILTASGYRTGLYTSPHLVRFNERIRVNGVAIPERMLAKYTRYFMPVIKKTRATFFEATTAIAFQYFADQNVDIAVIETGLGGRHDATNVLTPLLSIITSIGFDHTEQLGKSLSSIAYEKGGIIKREIPCLTGVTLKEPLSAIQTIAREKSSLLLRANKISAGQIKRDDLSGLEIDLKTDKCFYRNLRVSLAGNHQARNAMLAILAVEHLAESHGFNNITIRSVRMGLKKVQFYTGFRGRLHVIKNHPLTIVDVAHNSDGITTALSSLQRLILNKPVVVFGVMADKEYTPMITAIGKLARVVIAVQPNIARALESKNIIEIAQSLGVSSYDGKTVAEGIKLASKLVHSDEAIVIIGSHFVAGEVIR